MSVLEFTTYFIIYENVCKRKAKKIFRHVVKIVIFVVISPQILILKLIDFLSWQDKTVEKTGKIYHMTNPRTIG